MGFLDDYEDVQDRVNRFKIAFPVGRIVTDIIQFDPEKGFVLVGASIYREHEDTLPACVDYAFGARDTYPLNMRKFYVEDTVSSAIGRALNGVLETLKKPTKQDMAKVEAKVEEKTPPAQFLNTWEQFVEPKTVKEPVTLESVAELIQQELGATPDEPIPNCKHGIRHIKEGNKNGKPWRAAMCNLESAIMKDQRCAPIWYSISKSTGKWVLPDGVE